MLLRQRRVIHPHRRSRSSTSSQEPQNHFLALPAELRNVIYRMVLVNPDNTPIPVSASGYQRSGLLLTSKQIRKETLKIYYEENIFETSTSRYDITAEERWLRCVRNKPDLSELKIRDFARVADTRPHWRNLVRWLKLFHEKKVRGVPSPASILEAGQASDSTMAISGMFVMVNGLSGQLWQLVEFILMKQRPILIAIDAQWGEDEEVGA